jgi:NitT/TauT family transport system substrate-binding protein
MFRCLPYRIPIFIAVVSIFLVSHFFCPVILAEERDETPQIRVALLPILDSLPFYVAESKGFFKEMGVTVVPVPVNSGLDRDQLMQAGSVDGMLNEMTTTASFNRDGVKVKIVRDARRAYEHFPLFRVLAAPGCSLKSAKDLAGVPLGISKNTIIEYVTDRLLAEEGLDVKEISKQSVPVIPERFQLLLQGRLKAATLPDPLAKSALESGAILVVDDSSHPRYSVSVLSFSVKALQEKPDSVRLFLAAWDRAAAALNEDPDLYRGILLEKVRMPRNVENTYTIPPYPRNTVPASSQWNDVMEWMVQKGLLKRPLPYEESVTLDFITPAKGD